MKLRITGRTSGLACIALCAALVTSSIAHADDTSGEEQARLHFSAGVNLVRDPAGPRYEEAYAEFKRAYAIAKAPKILGNIGLCAMKLERDAEAIESYTRYLTEVPDLAPDERAQVERDVATLKATLATVTIEARPSAMIFDTRIPFQGDPVTNTHGPITARTQLGLRRGHHVLKARFEGGAEATWEADLNGGESHVFELPAVSAPTVSPAPAGASSSPITKDAARARPIPTTVYIAGGATLALGLGSLVTGLVAIDTRSRFDDRNDGNDPTAAEDLRGTGKALNVVSDVLLIGALVGAGITTYLYLTRPVAAQQARSPFSPLLRF